MLSRAAKVRRLIAAEARLGARLRGRVHVALLCTARLSGLHCPPKLPGQPLEAVSSLAGPRGRVFSYVLGALRIPGS